MHKFQVMNAEIKAYSFSADMTVVLIRVSISFLLWRAVSHMLIYRKRTRNSDGDFSTQGINHVFFVEFR